MDRCEFQASQGYTARPCLNNNLSEKKDKHKKLYIVYFIDINIHSKQILIDWKQLTETGRGEGSGYDYLMAKGFTLEW